MSVRDGYTIVDIPVALERADGFGRVVLNADRQVAGFFIRPGRQCREPASTATVTAAAHRRPPIAVGRLPDHPRRDRLVDGRARDHRGRPATWLLVAAIARRRVDPIAVVSVLTVAIALAAYALTGGDPLALELRRGAVTGTLGIAALASIALGRPLLVLVAEHVGKLNPERRPEIEARLADPARRRSATILTAIIGAIFTIDGASQIALALTVPTRMFVADSTAVRIVVLGTGFVVTAWYVRQQKHRRTPDRSRAT